MPTLRLSLSPSLLLALALTLLFPLTASAAASAPGATPAPPAARPNILWLTSEDHGIEMGCYGDALARTPHVDALAARGMIFKRAWSNHPVCAPARTTIATGFYGESSGGIHMRSMVPLAAGAKLYPDHLRAAGYYATNNAKEDYNVPKTAQSWDASSRQAHWKNRGAGQPFIAVFNSEKSHESQLRTRPHTAITDPAKVRIPAYHPDLPEVRRDWAQYYDKVSEADADAGARLKEIADAGLAEDTIVFYYGDHGSGMPRSKRWPSNSGLHVPLVVYFPQKWLHLAPQEYKAGGQSDRLVSFVDLAPTVLSLAGIKPPAAMQGHAFAGPFQTAPQPFLYGARGRMDERQDFVRSVTDGRYVYLRNFFPHVSQAQRVDYQFQTPTTRVWRAAYDAGKTNDTQSIFWRTPKAPEELYDLTADRDEVINLAASPAHRATLEKFRAAQRAHLTRVRDICFLPEGEMHARAAGLAPYDLARDEAKYPFARLYAAADLASGLDPAAVPQLRTLATDPDAAARYWGVIGFQMRGGAAVSGDLPLLRRALADASPLVRIVAAETLGTYGPAADLAPALAVLGELAAPDKNGVFTSVAALTAIEALGAKAAPLHAQLREIKADAGAPHPRFAPYVPRLIANITGDAEAPAAPAKKQGKKKAATP